MYSAFGGLLGQVVWGSNYQIPLTKDPVGFGGQWGYYTDQSTGLVLMGHRYYNPSNGRFLTRDPIGYGGGINLYGFVGNNPITNIDSDGTDPVKDYFQRMLGYYATLGSQVFSGVTGTISGVQEGVAEYKLMRKVGYVQAVKTTAGAQLSALGHEYTDVFNPYASAYAQGASAATIDFTAVTIAMGGMAFGKVGGVTGATEDAAGSAARNPFAGKTSGQIDQMLRAKGYEPRGPDPANGKGGYVNPRTGRSLHIDKANSYGEDPHVDINRPRGYKALPKKKLPFGT